jgi:hypothetical protein
MVLVTFAGATDSRNALWEARQRHLNDSALRHGFDGVTPWTRERLVATRFYAENRDLLDRERGAGYWAWKPYVILRALSEAGPGDHVVYWDVGQGRDGDQRVGNQFRQSVVPLIRWCDDVGHGILPGTRIAHQGPNRRWTKRDCFVLMGCDEPQYWNAPQVQASFSIWRREPRSLAFVETWVRMATDPRMVSDDPNTCGLPDFPEFVDHRHDQSILTNLAVQARLEVPRCAEYDSKDMNRLASRLGVVRRWSARARNRLRIFRPARPARRSR